MGSMPYCVDRGLILELARLDFCYVFADSRSEIS